MTEYDSKSLLDEIQAAFDNRDLAGVLRYYHSDICYIGPAFERPLEGIDSLKAAFTRFFGGQERYRIKFKDVHIRRLSPELFIVHCRVEGSRFIYLSEQRFKGYLSRVFVAGQADVPLIIHEHFSLTG